MSRKIYFVVEAELNEQEVEKLNRKAQRLGRAARTGEDLVENMLCDAMAHNWAVAKYSVVRTERIGQIEEPPPVEMYDHPQLGRIPKGFPQ